MLRLSAIIGILLVILPGCGQGEDIPNSDADRPAPVLTPQVERDLADIKEDGVLRAITIYSSTSYFLYRGQPLGFEYELLERFAHTQDLKLEMVVAQDIDELFDMLNRGEGDVVAHGLTITAPRREIVDFTRHHFTTHQTLVQRKPDNWRAMKTHNIDRQLVSDPIDLVGKTVHVRRNSSYYQRLENLSEEVGGEIAIEAVPGKLSTSDIIRMVANKEIDYTVADHHIAAINQTYYSSLDVNTQISTNQRIAWAVRKNSPQLKQVLDRWIEAEKRTAEYHVIFNKYFENQRSYRRLIESEFYSKNAGKISRYDSLIQATCTQLGWDWRLVSSLVYQESRFDPSNRSWAGARGLMQLMPATARELGVRNPTDPVDNVAGGVRYLQQLYDRWEEIPDSVQRIKFAMASYNCGLGHVLDAQRLAEKYDRDPLLWDEHVEDYLLRLSDRRFFTDDVVRYGYARGREPYRYVQDIFARYDHYQRFIEA
jgi:membrane-bound lytic murein transglycosylase F